MRGIQKMRSSVSINIPPTAASGTCDWQPLSQSFNDSTCHLELSVFCEDMCIDIPPYQASLDRTSEIAYSIDGLLLHNTKCVFELSSYLHVFVCGHSQMDTLSHFSVAVHSVQCTPVTSYSYNYVSDQLVYNTALSIPLAFSQSYYSYYKHLGAYWRLWLTNIRLFHILCFWCYLMILGVISVSVCLWFAVHLQIILSEALYRCWWYNSTKCSLVCVDDDWDVIVPTASAGEPCDKKSISFFTCYLDKISKVLWWIAQQYDICIRMCVDRCVYTHNLLLILKGLVADAQLNRKLPRQELLS